MNATPGYPWEGGSFDADVWVYEPGEEDPPYSRSVGLGDDPEAWALLVEVHDGGDGQRGAEWVAKALRRQIEEDVRGDLDRADALARHVRHAVGCVYDRGFLAKPDHDRCTCGAAEVLR